MKDRTNLTTEKTGSWGQSLPPFLTLLLTALIFIGASGSAVRAAGAAVEPPLLVHLREISNARDNIFGVFDLAPAATTPFFGNTIHVTTTAQGIADDGLCSLQEAIYSANLDFGVAPASFDPLVTFDTGCAPGSGDDTIVLEAGKEYLMTAPLDDPYNPVGPTANPIVLSNMTIDANGARLVRANPFRDFAGTNFRAFAVAKRAFADPNDDLDVQGAGTGSLLIRNAHIKGFTAKGGDGRSGGGGGMGAGGAIYVHEARLSIENSTFEDNGAGGGKGSWNPFGPGGGGGGMGGNGGLGQGNTFLPLHDPTDADFVGLGEGPGGGGGGSRGNGGANGFTSDFFRGWATTNGGGGGGTLSNGEAGGSHVSQPSQNGLGGIRCGGTGGHFMGDGGNATCPGGGGGGGEPAGTFREGGNAGHGHYGGGGGGGGYHQSNTAGFAYGRRGGRGGFGGGGGAGGEGDHGGNGGFGGGGGAGSDSAGRGGIYGMFGGDGNDYYGGGGAGLGGAIFNHKGTVTVWNSTFTGNFAVRGTVTPINGYPDAAEGGSDAGGAIFSLNGTLEIYNSTISRNETTGDLGAVVALSAYDVPLLPIPPEPSASFTLYNTIIANNGVTSDGVSYSNSNGECLAGGINFTKVGSHNLIVDNHGAASNVCPGAAVTADPHLLPLALNEPGITPTMALPPASPAVDAGTDLIDEGVITDQRGVARLAGTYDIGAYELWINSVPEAVSPDPAPATNEDTQVSIILKGTDADEQSLTFAITDSPDHGALGAVRTPICSAGNCIAAVTYFPSANYNGADSFKFKVNDGEADSGEVTVSITVNPVNDTPSVTAAPLTQADVQYSDLVQPVSITAADLETPAASLTVSTSHTKNGGSPVIGLPAGLTLTDNGVSGSGARQWTVSGNANVPAGTYVIKAEVTDRGDPDNIGTSPAITIPSSFTLNVIREDAVVTASASLTAIKVASAGGTSPQFELSASVAEEADGSPGDISKAGPLTFTLSPVGGGTSPTCTNDAGTASGTELTIGCSFSNVRVGVYEVNIAAGGEYYTGGGSTVLTVYDPSLGNVIGSGWLINPITGFRATFGVNVKYLRNGMAQGQVLYIEHRPEGDFKVKSNAMQNAAILRNEAQITAKAIYLDVGNYVVIARVIDNKDLGTDDKFGLKLIDPSGQPVADLTFLNYPAPLGGGNNLVPKK